MSLFVSVLSASLSHSVSRWHSFTLFVFHLTHARSLFPSCSLSLSFSPAVFMSPCVEIYVSSSDVSSPHVDDVSLASSMVVVVQDDVTVSSIKLSVV